jgi:hypothetical protein
MDRYDILGAILMGFKPHFQFELINATPDLELEDFEPNDLIRSRYKTRLSNLTGLQDRSQETMNVYCALRHLINEREKAAGVKGLAITNPEYQLLQLYSLRLMYRLIALTQHKTSDLPNQNSVIYELFGNGGLIHVLMFTHNVAPHLGDLRLLSKRIQISLETIDMQAFQIAYPEMILWIIMMGGLGSIGTEDTKWFIQLLAKACRATGIATTAELVLFLTDFLWSEFYLPCPLFKEFWDNFREEMSEGV